MNFWRITLNIAFIVVSILGLIFTIRGVPGSPDASNMGEARWYEDGPFELSPDRGRYALMYSVVEDHSLQFSLPVARFALPDLAIANGKYVSLFPPGLSYFIIPGYLLGKSIGFGQLGIFLIVALTACLNTWLIRAIAMRLGAPLIPATLAALTFLFATPAFAYAVSLYQHHLSLLCMLLAIYVLQRWQGIWTVAVVGILTALSIPVDNPNAIFMMPMVIYALLRLFTLSRSSSYYALQVHIGGMVLALLAFIPVGLYLWFNVLSHGDALKLSGTLPGVSAIDDAGKPAVPKLVSSQAQVDKEKIKRLLNPELQKKTATSFFRSRNILNGIYVHFLSWDRGILFFTPIMLIGFWGIRFLPKKEGSIAPVLLGLLGANLILYSMWGDPWGGWGFGSRYLVPGYAVLAILLAFVMSRMNRNWIVIPLISLGLCYSLAVNTLGAITTNRVPHQGDAEALAQLSGKVERYSYDRNYELLQHGQVKSFVYNQFFSSKLHALDYYWILVATLTVPLVGLLVVMIAQTYPFNKTKSYQWKFTLPNINLTRRLLHT